MYSDLTRQVSKVKAGLAPASTLLNLPLVKNNTNAQDGFLIVACPDADTQAEISALCLRLGNDHIQVASLEGYHFLRIDKAPIFLIEECKDRGISLYVPDITAPSLLVKAGYSHPGSSFLEKLVPTSCMALLDEDGSYTIIPRPHWDTVYNFLDMTINVKVHDDAYKPTAKGAQFTNNFELISTSTKTPITAMVLSESKHQWYVELLLSRMDSNQVMYFDMARFEDDDGDIYYILTWSAKIPSILDFIKGLGPNMDPPTDVIYLSYGKSESIWIPQGHAFNPDLPKEVLISRMFPEGNNGYFCFLYSLNKKKPPTRHIMPRSDFRNLASFRMDFTLLKNFKLQTIQNAFKFEIKEF